MFRKTHFAALAMVLLAPAAARAQDSPAARQRATELSRAWGAIAQGDYASAEQIAARLLRARPVDHASVTVAVAAGVGARHSVAALDLYEGWLRQSGHEDVPLLQTIGVAMLAAIGDGDDSGLAVRALTRVAAYDADAARAALARRGDAEEFDPVRAVLGDRAARARIGQRLAAATSRERLLALTTLPPIDALPREPIVAALADPAPPVRAAAAEALARIQGAAAADSLRPLLADTDPFVQATAAVVLGRLGDAEGLTAVARMATSPVPDTAAMAAAVLKERGADVSAIAERVLAADNPLTRLSAAPLLADPARSAALLSDAASDPNPVIRARAGELMAASLTNLAAIRRMLRDSSSEVRLNAGLALLTLRPQK